MKKILFIISCIMFTALNQSCEKDYNATIQEQTRESTYIRYTINNIPFYMVIQNPNQMNTLISHLIELTQQGFTITIWDEHKYQNIGCKEIIKFENTDVTIVEDWCIKMVKKGYMIEISFDVQRKIFVGTAQK